MIEPGTFVYATTGPRKGKVGFFHHYAKNKNLVIYYEDGVGHGNFKPGNVKIVDGSDTSIVPSILLQSSKFLKLMNEIEMEKRNDKKASSPEAKGVVAEKVNGKWKIPNKKNNFTSTPDSVRSMNTPRGVFVNNTPTVASMPTPTATPMENESNLEKTMFILMATMEKLTISVDSTKQSLFRKIDEMEKKIEEIESRVTQSTAAGGVSSEGQMVDYDDMQHGENMLEAENL